MLILRARKGQIALEFIIMISFTLIIFSGFYGALLHKQNVAMKHNMDLEAKLLADQLGYELDLALTQGSNFTKTFDLPSKISVYNYNITYEVLENYTAVYLNYDNRYTIGYTSANLTGALYAGTNTIRNLGGVIYAN